MEEVYYGEDFPCVDFSPNIYFLKIEHSIFAWRRSQNTNYSKKCTRAWRPSL